MYAWLLCRYPRLIEKLRVNRVWFHVWLGFQFWINALLLHFLRFEKLFARVEFSTPCCFMFLPIEGFGHVCSWLWKRTFKNSLTLHWFVFISDHWRHEIWLLWDLASAYLFSKHHLKTLYHQPHISFVAFAENIKYMNCLFLNENFVTMNFNSMMGCLPKMHYKVQFYINFNFN